MLDEAKADALEQVIARHWPEQIDPADLCLPSLAASIKQARLALLDTLGLAELT